MFFPFLDTSHLPPREWPAIEAYRFIQPINGKEAISELAFNDPLKFQYYGLALREAVYRSWDRPDKIPSRLECFQADIEDKTQSMIIQVHIKRIQTNWSGFAAFEKRRIDREYRLMTGEKEAFDRRHANGPNVDHNAKKSTSVHKAQRESAGACRSNVEEEKEAEEEKEEEEMEKEPINLNTVSQVTLELTAKLNALLLKTPCYGLPKVELDPAAFKDEATLDVRNKIEELRKADTAYKRASGIPVLEGPELQESLQEGCPCTKEDMQITNLIQTTFKREMGEFSAHSLPKDTLLYKVMLMIQKLGLRDEKRSASTYRKDMQDLITTTQQMSIEFKEMYVDHPKKKEEEEDDEEELSAEDAADTKGVIDPETMQDIMDNFFKEMGNH